MYNYRQSRETKKKKKKKKEIEIEIEREQGVKEKNCQLKSETKTSPIQCFRSSTSPSTIG